MERIEHEHTIDILYIESLCPSFLESHFYGKAMSDANYERMQDIQDFLLAHFPSQTSSIEVNQLNNLAISIRENYYRYF